MNEPEAKLDEMNYLVFQVLVDIKGLERLAPNHYLVKAVRAAVEKELGVTNPNQLVLEL